MNDVAKPVKVKATIMWCFHNKPNEMSNKFQVDLCNLSDNAVKALESLGLEVRKREDKPEKGFYITCKSTVPMKVFPLVTDLRQQPWLGLTSGLGKTRKAFLHP